MSQFSELSFQLTKQLSKTEKKKYGIFLTPQCIIQKIHKSILELAGEEKIQQILEPSCGSCEIIQYLDSHYENVKIDGVELNETIYQSIQSLSFQNEVSLINHNFLEYKPEKQYDLIIGNPPYFVCSKSDISPAYKEYMIGRPNIFVVFILHALSLLRKDGILAFIIPKSFLNSMYYSQVRNYIKQTCLILKIEDYSPLNKFIDTEQSTFGMILQKKEEIMLTECDYSIRINHSFMFSENTKELKKILEGSTTLEKMGFKVRTGQIVWNEHKEILTDKEEETLLIYNTNISKTNEIEIKHFKNDEKKQYIQKEGKQNPCLVVNRGNGNSKYKLQFALIERENYLIENHLNEIYFPQDIKKETLMELYKKIIKSFQNPKTKKFIELFLGNNGLSKTELETIFPIYDI